MGARTGLLKLFVAGMVITSGSAAFASNQESCILPDEQQMLSCLNTTLIPSLVPAAEQTFKDYYHRLSQSYQLPVGEGDLSSFRSKYFPQDQMPAVEMVGSRLDGSGKTFRIIKDSYFLVGKRKAEKLLRRNAHEALQFVAYFHARNFGKKNGLLFNFNRVEISALNVEGSEGVLALDGQTLRINLPEDREIKAKDLLQLWNSGDVLLTQSQASTPRAIMKVFAHFGSQKDKMGMKVLENWSFFNPISDFRVQLAALYHGHSKTLIQKLQKLPDSQFKSWIQELVPQEQLQKSDDLKDLVLASMNSADVYAGALDSLFSEKKSSGSGDINIINRKTGLCLIKVSNSHVIKVDWDESEFGDGTVESVSAEIKIDGGKVDVTAASHQDVHVVNDQTWVGGVCVDTNDNVQVNLDSLLRAVKKRMTDKALVKMAAKRII
ncbi:hypothetical protein ACNQKP_07170 [Bdellovibrio bacteriovorus]|uniref:hypothetical protein n=1 Tax=Bdellovibrio bacteriovorus TaxID=959 RepID=UPI003AA851C5